MLRFSVEFDEVADEASNHREKTIGISRCLKRAPFVNISPAALEAVDPELKGVALESILDGLKARGPQLYATARSTKIFRPSDLERMPRELDVQINDISSEAPTHLLAIHALPCDRVILFPVHSIILASQCARIPPFPPSPSRTLTEAGSKITFAVTPFRVPSPETLLILLGYLYTKNLGRLMTGLLPKPLEGSSDDERLRWSSTLTTQTLLSHVARVHGIWNNMVALGIFDEALLKMIEAAWAILLRELAVSAPGATWLEAGAGA